MYIFMYNKGWHIISFSFHSPGTPCYARGELSIYRRYSLEIWRL